MTSEPARTAPASLVGAVTGEPEPTSPGGGSSGLASAQAAAVAAADAARVTVRNVGDLAELSAVARLCAEIWQGGTGPPLTSELLRALVKAGNYVAGAFDGPTLVGACVGFFSAPAEHALHSHIAGVAHGVRSHNVGFALKVHQRAWAMQRDVEVIEWTYDPLVARNAHVNINKLGARPVEYLPNFYGGMDDVINSGGDTDRMLVRWRLDSPAVAAASAGRHSASDARAERSGGAVVALDISAAGAPAPGVLDAPGPLSAATVLVAVPSDIESLRRTDPDAAREWRMAVRESLTTLLARGAEIVGFDRAGWYVIRSPGPVAGSARPGGRGSVAKQP